MLRFFSRIRKSLLSSGATRKYILYASGEIALVVIGILIALQVNNWNSNRVEQLRIKSYAESLIQDLHEDIEHINAIIINSQSKQKRIDSLAAYVRNKKIHEISNEVVLFLCTRVMHTPHSWNRATLNELQSSGSLRNMKNDSLANAIVAYESFTHHLDQDYLNDISYYQKATESLSLIVNSNYSNIDDIFWLIGGFDRGETEVDIFQSNEFEKAVAAKLDFLSDDISILKRAVNDLTNLRLYLSIRSGNEFKRLTKDAEDIILMLKDEYGI